MDLQPSLQLWAEAQGVTALLPALAFYVTSVKPNLKATLVVE